MHTEPGPDASTGATREWPDSAWGRALAELPLWRTLILALICGGLVLAACKHAELSETWSSMLLMSVLYAAPMSYWVVVLRRRGYSTRDVLGEPPSWASLRLTLLVALATFTIHIGWVALIALLDRIPESWTEPIVDTHGPAEQSVWVLIAVVLDPPVEELAFRGAFYRRLLRRLRPVWAALATSIVFGLLHPDPVGITLLGLALVALARSTRSLWAPILAHACNNALGVWMSSSALDLDERWVWVIAAAQLICLPWLARMLWRALRDEPAFVTGRPRPLAAASDGASAQATASPAFGAQLRRPPDRDQGA